MQGLQGTQLQPGSIQGSQVGFIVTQKVLLSMPQAHRAQGNEIGFNRPVARIGRAADSKSAGWGFESLLACQLEGIR